MGTLLSCPLPMRARQVVLLTPPKSSHPRPLLSRQHFVPVSPLAATLTKTGGVGGVIVNQNPAQNLSPACSRASRERISAKGLPGTLQQETSAPLCPLLLQSSGTRTAGPNVSTLRRNP